MKLSTVLSSAAVAAILAGSISRPLPTHAASPLEFIKATGNPAVYLIQNGQRHAYPLLSIYQSWFGNDFGGVVEFSSSQVAGYTLGKNVLFKPGTLIKIQTDPKVYVVKDLDGNLEWIKTEADLRARGYTFKDVHDVPDSLFPDYHLPADFATPQNPAPQNPGTTIPPVVTISNPEISVGKDAGSNAFAIFAFTANQPVSGTLTYTDGVTTSTIDIANVSSLSKKVSTTTGVAYTYVLSVKGADGIALVKTGSFRAYSDVLVTAGPTMSTSTALITPSVIVGTLKVKNNSKDIVYLNALTVTFESVSSITDRIGKSLFLYRLLPGGTRGDVLGQRDVSTGTTIRGSAARQRFPVTETLAPGEERSYAVQITNFENLNPDGTASTDVFTTKIAQLEFGGEPSVVVVPEILSTLTYTRP